VGIAARAEPAFRIAACFGVLMAPTSTRAQCCSGYAEATACAGVTLTKSRWCIQDTVPTGQAALPAEFCGYGDEIIGRLETTFNIPAPDVFEIQLDAQTGGAHTGTSCGVLGEGVAYDAFTGSAYGTQGFWGYLLSLHEAINVWTGMTSPGWPTDWWADHQSAFPNLMDFHIMGAIGVDSGNQDLIQAAAIQKERFYPGGDSADPKVVALDNVFAVMPYGDGFAGFSHMFALQSADGVRWDDLAVPNPDVKRTEYVVAYMCLAARQQLLSVLQGPGPNGGGDICNDTPNGAGDEPYTCSEDNINAIATAHCSIAANGMPAADLAALRSGDYLDVPSGPCGGTCPEECGCDDAGLCVPSWLATDGGDGDSSGTGGTSGTGSSDGTSSGAGTGTAEGSTGGNGSSGTAGSGGEGSGPSGDTSGVSGSSGCGCRTASAGNERGRSSGSAAALALVALVLVRRRARAGRP